MGAGWLLRDGWGWKADSQLADCLSIRLYVLRKGFPLESCAGDGMFRPSILLFGVWILRAYIGKVT